jgi:UDP-xylose/UDP-N-acetylglucosamine transporter B4
LTITLRKFVSLVVSVIYFNNPFTFLHWAGAAFVLFGTAAYTFASSSTPAPAKPAADENRAKRDSIKNSPDLRRDSLPEAKKEQ